MHCWMNGQYMQAEDLRISPFDHGFLYGLGFFETFRTYNGKVLFLEEHYKRLTAALTQYHIHMPYTEEAIREVIEELTKQADYKDGYFRLNVSAGIHDIGLQPTAYTEPTVIVFRKELQATPRGQEKMAKWLMTPRNIPEQEIRVKSHHYGNNVLGRFEVPSLATTEGFFVTPKGYVAEGVTSNIFWVEDDILYTPSLQTGILPGITRRWVLNIAQALGYRVREGLFRKEELEKAQECFITNSIQELVPISKIDNYLLLGDEGPAYNRFHQAYIEEIFKLSKER
ncbi:MAG: aminodeoxychorismate lyase [Lysinibacillus sp.]